MAEFSLEIKSNSPTTAVVILSGTMGVLDFDRIEDGFGTLLDGGASGVILDLSRLENMSSAGLGAIVNLAKILTRRAGKLILAAPNENVNGLLEMLGIPETLPVASTMEEARKKLSAK